MGILSIIIAGELFVITILLMAILSCLHQILEMVRPPPQVGVLRGNVSYGDTSLIEGVLMTLTQDGVTVASVLTGAAGDFAFDPMALGVYYLQGHKDLPDGWLEYAQVEVEINAPEINVGDLPLVKPGGASK